MFAKRNRFFWSAVILGLCMLLPAAACSNTASRQPDVLPVQHDTVFQISTIDATMQGIYDGEITIGELKKHGDVGTGTLQSLDGELVALDGEFYQIKVDGKVYSLPDSAVVPFGAVTFFETDLKEPLAENMTGSQFQSYLDGLLPTINIFHAIRIEGTFKYVKARSVPMQQKPYPSLIEVTRNQPVFEFDDIRGVIVGLRCPPNVGGLNVTGYHLHFINDDRTCGGHILDFTIRQAEVSVDFTHDFTLLLPGQETGFYDLDLDPAKQEDVSIAEQ